MKMPNERIVSRKLEPVRDKNGRIITWKCSACAWEKVPDLPFHGPTQNTLKLFDSHDCAEYSVIGDRKRSSA